MNQTREGIQEKSVELAWRNRLHPAINKSKFSNEEIAQLHIFRNEYQKSWVDISRALSSGEMRRTPLQCLTAYQKAEFEAPSFPHSRIEKLKLAKLLPSDENVSKAPMKAKILEFFKGMGSSLKI